MKFTQLITMSMVFAFFPTHIANAQSGNDQVTKLYKCRAIGDDQKRLICYDKAALELETASQKGEIITITKKEVETMEKESFGFNLPSLPKLSAIFGTSKSKDKSAIEKKLKKKTKALENKSLIAPIQSVRIYNGRHTRFYLKNGQIWEQISGTKLNLRIRKDRPASVHIFKGAMGGYRLRVNNKGKMIKVRRVQ